MNQRWDKQAARLFVALGLLAGLERTESRRSNVLRILAYHRIGHPEAESERADPTLFSATPEQFAEQMQYLADHYAVLSVDDLLAALDSGRALPPRSVMITFDDGYRDFGEHAWPVLKRLGLPAVLFVPTAYLTNGQNRFWWDELYGAVFQTEARELSLPGVGFWPMQNAVQRSQVFLQVKSYLKTLNHRQTLTAVDQILQTLEVEPQAGAALLGWEDVRRMSQEGLTVGPHTRTHPLLSRITLQEARQEIAGSQQDILDQVGRAWPVFAYPSGHPDDLCVELTTVLQQEGFRLAVTMIEGHNVLGRTPLLQLRRLGMAPHLSLDEFRLALTGVYNLYGSWLRRRVGV
jgi:peptidoglycan/xylan/chitin deacetylase (PgdA/CDA1 family)